jgi:hypothetical protein
VNNQLCNPTKKPTPMAENVEFEEINDAHNEAQNELCNTPQNSLEQDLKMWMDVSEMQQGTIRELQADIVAIMEFIEPFLEIKEELKNDGFSLEMNKMELAMKLPSLLSNLEKYGTLFDNITKKTSSIEGAAVIQKYANLMNIDLSF